MKIEQQKTGIYIKGSAEVYHSVTYMYGYYRFFAFSFENSYYKLEEKQDQEGCTTIKLMEVSKKDFDALIMRYHQMTKRWRSKRNVRTLGEEHRDQVVEFSHDCKKHLNLKRGDVEVFTENSFKKMLEKNSFL